MNRRKNSTKQEHHAMVQKFLNNGQSKSSWCKANGIATGTFYRWLEEYNTTHKEVSFVALKPKKKIATQISPNHNEVNPSNHIIVEVGSCKIHIPESIDRSIIIQLIQEMNALHA